MKSCMQPELEVKLIQNVFTPSLLEPDAPFSRSETLPCNYDYTQNTFLHLPNVAVLSQTPFLRIRRCLTEVFCSCFFIKSGGNFDSFLKINKYQKCGDQ